MALARSDGVAVADPRAARPRRRAELRPRTLIRRFEPAAAETREGAPRASPAALRDGRGAAPTLPTSSGHRARTFAVSTMMTREPTRKLMVQRRRARPGGLRGCAEPLRGLSRRLDAQRAFRSSNTKLSRVWLTLPPVAAALLALPGQKLNRFLAIRRGSPLPWRVVARSAAE